MQNCTTFVWALCVCSCVCVSKWVSLCEPLIHLLTYFGYLQLLGLGLWHFEQSRSTCKSRLLSALDWFTVKMHLPLLLLLLLLLWLWPELWKMLCQLLPTAVRNGRKMQSARFAEKFHNAKWSKNIKLQHTQKSSQNVVEEAEKEDEEEDGEDNANQK